MESKKILRVCSCGMICVALASNLIPVYLTTFSEVFGGLDKEQLGRIPGFLFIGWVTGILICGPLADRLGPKIFLGGGFGLASVGLVFLAGSFSYPVLLTASVVCGVGTGVLDMIVSPVVSAACTTNRSSALNGVHSFFCVGAVGTLVIASLGLEVGISWRLVTLGFAIFPGLLAAYTLSLDLPPLTHPEMDRQGFRHLIRMPMFYVAMLTIGLIGATDSGIAQWLPAYAEQEFGCTKATGGYLLTAFSIAMGIGRWLASKEKGKIPPVVLVGAGAAFCAVLYWIGTLSTNPFIALGACVLVGFGTAALWPTCLGMTADRFPQGGATLFCLLAAGGNIGCLVVPWAEGAVAELLGLRTAILIASIFPITLAAMMVFLWKREKKPTAA